MITMETFDEIVQAIYNSGDKNAKVLANEAALYYDMAIICATKGVQRAMNYYKTEKGNDLYSMYLQDAPETPEGCEE